MPIVQNVTRGKFDPEILPLVEALNQAGIRTIASCSGHGKASAYLAIDMASLEMVRVHKEMLVLDWKFPAEKES
jgi:tRNA(Phe) wybutosine-synthesizing methylase Tyw3